MVEEKQMAAEQHSFKAALIRRIIQILLGTALWFACFFVAAGRTNVPRAWIYLAAGLAVLAVTGMVVGRRNPEVIKARAYGGAGTKVFDKIFGVFFFIFMFAVPVIAGLDAVRFGWAPLAMFWLWPGLVIYVFSNVPVIWAMAENRHLEQTVRIQEDRGHQAIMTGPYKYVRHPMYSGMILQHGATPLILGSLWAFVPVAALCASILARTALEDATLRRELFGYGDFAQRTRYRLLPGVW
ncbi:MAG: isoprenylcysteine carboxylmethyltransferase family protein [Vicinamibacteria bacterium]|nr:isoprenylcysteine carboxylmethyltransferase family protein [Vicinamibacteria bacterium]